MTEHPTFLSQTYLYFYEQIFRQSMEEIQQGFIHLSGDACLLEARKEPLVQNTPYNILHSGKTKTTIQMKIIAYIVGSEARWLIKTFPTDLRKIPYITFVKIRAWLLRPIIQEYWVDNEYLLEFIYKFKRNAKTRIVKDEIKYPVKFPKIKHRGFMAMYYYPKNEYNRTYCRWVYGKDLIESLIEKFPYFYWIRIDGTLDLPKIFPWVDVYIRPNRHDGSPRLIRECEIQNIPYYHSQCNPNIKEIVEFLIEQYELKDETIREEESI